MLQIVVGLLAIGIGLFLWERFPAFKWILAVIIAAPILLAAFVLFEDHAAEEKRQQEQAEQAQQHDPVQRESARSAIGPQNQVQPPSIQSTSGATSYLYDILRKPQYRQAWLAFFSGEQNVDDWLSQYANTFDGSASPVTTIELGGSHYQISNVCKTHDCGDNKFYVLFAQDGSKAWGLLLKNGKIERFFGSPDDDLKNALRTAANT